MPGIAMDGSEDLPSFDLQNDNVCSEVPHQPVDYLSQKLANAHGELKILADNIQLLDDRHIKRLIEINATVSQILLWQQLDRADN